MKTQPTDPVPFCLILPLMRVATGLGSERDFAVLEDAGPAYREQVPRWLADLEEASGYPDPGKTSCPPLRPEEWAERLLVGLEARRALRFEWVDNKDGGELAAQLRNPSTDGPEYAAAIHVSTVSGACSPEYVTRWTATMHGGATQGTIHQSGPAGIAAAKRAVEHAFLAAWEAAR